MTVYVDDMYKFAIGKYGRMRMSHMIADTEEELHQMAKTIGLDLNHFQGDHYDVCMAYRDKALKAGASSITMRQCAAMNRLKRWGLEMGDPKTAEKRIRERWNATLGKQCPRCKEWQRMGLSNTCPSCDEARLERFKQGLTSGE